jgi:hypothetical protein
MPPTFELSAGPRSLARQGAPRLRMVAIGAAVAVAAAVTPAGAASAQDEEPDVGVRIPTQEIELRDDGSTATDGTRTLTVSAARDLDPNGHTVEVTGTGFDESKGIYLAFCVLPARDEVPTPCGGGADIEGAAGSSVWISSNPPPYGEALAVAYEPGGSFAATITVLAEIGNDVDCREVACAVTSRNDHVRTSDRGQDVYVPVTFEGSPDPQAPEQTAIVNLTPSRNESARAWLVGTLVAAVVVAAVAVVVVVRVRVRRRAGS